jgi:NADPH:quinone reductase-like Zn-dependent oxidoreductase
MKAIVQDEYGPVGVLELRDIDRPPIGDDDVLFQVRAAGVDPGVWILMTGRPYLMRAMGFGLRRPKVTVCGRDLAGLVEAAGTYALPDAPDAIRYLAEGHAAGKVVVTV